MLFEMFERKIDGVFRPNMFVMTAANYEGEEYIKNIDYADPALRRRQIFLEWVPNKDDVEDYMSEKNYHRIIREVIGAMDMSNIIDHDTSNELEQTTQLGSWALLNNRWNKMEKDEHKKIDYSSARDDIRIFGGYMFNDSTIEAITNKLTLFEQMNTIDIHQEIIVNEGLNDPDYVMHDKQGNVYEHQNKKSELRIRAKFFVIDQILKDLKYLKDNGLHIVKLFRGRPEMFVSFFEDVNKTYKREALAQFKDKDEAMSNAEIKIMKFNRAMMDVRKANEKDPDVKKIFKDFSEGISIMHSPTKQAV